MEDPQEPKQPGDVEVVEAVAEDRAPEIRIADDIFRPSAAPGATPVPKWKVYLKWSVAALLALAAVVAGVLAVRHFMHADELEQAVHRAGDSGRPVAIEAAIAWIDGHDLLEGDPALRARLRAMAAMEGELGVTVAELEEAVGSLPDGSERKTTETYLALLEGDAAGAQAAAAALQPVLPYAAESAHARALAALATGDLSTAVALASSAAEYRPGAPRHNALFALASARNRSVDRALAVLDDAQASPAVEAMRARILVDARRDPARARAAAESVTQSADATVVEKAWARLVLGRLAAKDGLRGQALAELEQAASSGPLWDETFVLGLAEGFLEARRPGRAAEVAQRLPEQGLADPERHAQVRAALALQQGDLDAAGDALMNAPSSAPVALLRGEIHAARGELDAARERLREAAQDAWLAPEALMRLAALELEDDEAEDADRVATEALAKAPNHPDIVPVAVRAKLALGASEAAMALAEAAIAARGEDARLLAAKARVEMAAGRWQEALAILRRAVERDASDPDVLADRGEAARQVGERDEARQSFTAALELHPRHPDALSGMLELQLDALELEPAKETLEAIDALRLTTLRVDLLRARWYVARGAGNEGLPSTLAAQRRHRQSGEIDLQLGELYLQSGIYNRAITSFETAARKLSDRRAADAGAALAYMRSRRPRQGLQLVDRTRERLAEAGQPTEPTARELVVQGYGELAERHYRPAEALARRALQASPESSDAYLLLAAVAEAQDQDAQDSLRRAAAGRSPSGAAALELASALGPTEEGCAFARQALAALPRASARAAADVERRCPR